MAPGRLCYTSAPVDRPRAAGALYGFRAPGCGAGMDATLSDDIVMDRLYISKEGLDSLKEELAYMKEKRTHVADAIEHARSLGDLKENSEYHAAKEEQAMLSAKIKDVEDKIARAVVLEDTDIDTSKAYLGAHVKVRNGKTGKEMTYTLVSPVEADLAAGKISVESPVGKALLGTQEGDEVVAKVPAGDLPLEVLEISR